MGAKRQLGANFGFVLWLGHAKLLARSTRRGGRVAEGGGLLNRYTVNSRIVGSNPIPSATTIPLIRGASRQTIEAQIWPSVPVFGRKWVGPICARIPGNSGIM